MDNEGISTQRDRLLLELALNMGASSDEYMLRQLKGVSPEYARGYIDAFACNAADSDILFVYQVMRLVNMA